MSGLRVGIIGLGGAGRAHAARFRRNKDVGEIVAFDRKPVDLPGVEFCDSIDVMLEKVDAVSVCTPDDTHLDYIRTCMDRNKHVLVEKPMVSSHDEALALGDILARHPHLTFAVHHQMRYVPAFQAAKQLIDQNRLGRVFYMEANYWHDMRARNVLFDNWRIEGRGQSVIFGGACHPLDLMLHLCSREPVGHRTYLSKSAYSDYPGLYTSATTIMRFDDGMVAKCHTNNCVVFPQLNNLVILGDKGSYIDGVLYRGDDFEIVSQYHEKGSIHSLLERLTVELPSSIALFLLRRRRLFRTSPFSAYNHEHACHVIVDNFVDAVMNDAPVLVGYADGCRVVRLCEQTEADGLADFGQGGEDAGDPTCRRRHHG